MGIPQFYRRWIKTVDSVTSLTLEGDVVSLSIDANALVHETAHQVGDRVAAFSPKLFAAITNNIDNIAQKFNPDALIFAIDGPAPGGKLAQQRVRRMEAKPGKFNSNVITPGTQFMFDLDAHLQSYFETTKDSYRDVIYSGHLCPGEGEHKIMDYYRSGVIGSTVLDNSGYHVIYGADADLIMLTLLSEIPNIVIMRNDQQKNIVEYLYIDAIRQELTSWGVNVQDFVLLMFFLGNDFVPISPCMVDVAVSIDELVKRYVAYRQTIGFDKQTKYQSEEHSAFISNKDIDWPSLLKFIVELNRQQFEAEMLSKVVSKNYPIQPEIYRASIVKGKTGKMVFGKQMFSTLWYKQAFENKGSKELQNKILSIASSFSSTPMAYAGVDDDRKRKMVSDYFKTFNWLYYYYTRGYNSINQDWLYPYTHAPLISDLALFQYTQPFVGHLPYDAMLKFTCIHQLVAVFPSSSASLVPPEFATFFGVDSPIADMYSTRFSKIVVKGSYKDYEMVTLAPLIDRERIVSAVNTIPLSPETAEKWLSGEDLHYSGKKASNTGSSIFGTKGKSIFGTKDSSSSSSSSSSRNPPPTEESRTIAGKRVTLADKRTTAIAKPAISKSPIAKPAISKSPIAKPAIAKPAISKSPIAKPAISKSPIAKPAIAKPATAKPAIAKLPNASVDTKKPVRRNDFESMFMANMGTTVVDVPVYVKPKPVLKITQEKIESITSPETNCNFGPVRIPRSIPVESPTRTSDPKVIRTSDPKVIRTSDPKVTRTSDPKPIKTTTKFPFNAPKVREEDLLMARNLVNTSQGQAEIDALTNAEDPVIIFD